LQSRVVDRTQLRDHFRIEAHGGRDRLGDAAGIQDRVDGPTVALLVILRARGLADNVVRKVGYRDSDALQDGRISWPFALR
jgi:hypothetical protein